MHFCDTLFYRTNNIRPQYKYLIRQECGPNEQVCNTVITTLAYLLCRQVNRNALHKAYLTSIYYASEVYLI